jgi:hypothetical protein
MTNRLQQASTADYEYLDLRQAALMCSVSE